MLIDGEIDVCTGGHGFTKARAKVVDFSIPLGWYRYTLIAMRRSNSHAPVEFWVYVRVLRPETWLGAAVVVLILSMAFFAVNTSDIAVDNR